MTLFDCEAPVFIPYEDLMFLMKNEIEFKGKIDYNSSKYPLICIRGTCNCCCDEKKDIEPYYCFSKIPCINHRPDGNFLSPKYPNFDEFLFSVVDFANCCPGTDTFIVMFRYTPDNDNRELEFQFVVAAVLVKGTKITFITDVAEIKDLYEEYNTKYPTQDRKIENDINREMEGFYFRF